LLVGSRLTLRPLTPHDAQRLLTVPGPRAFSVDGYPSTLVTEVLRLVADCPDELGGADDGLGPWLITRRSDGVIVGLLRAAPTEPTAVTVGYEVAPGERGRGYATEAVQRLVAHLLGLPEVSRVCADTRVGNIASRRVLEKAGLSWERDARDRVDGRMATLAHYAIERQPGQQFG
jgi:RimJ/RimL family protein N-acetyltransferase